MVGRCKYDDAAAATDECPGARNGPASTSGTVALVSGDADGQAVRGCARTRQPTIALVAELEEMAQN